MNEIITTQLPLTLPSTLPRVKYNRVHTIVLEDLSLRKTGDGRVTRLQQALALFLASAGLCCQSIKVLDNNEIQEYLAGKSFGEDIQGFALVFYVFSDTTQDEEKIIEILAQFCELAEQQNYFTPSKEGEDDES